MLKNAHVLIADDDNNGRRMLDILVTKLGYQVSSAADGAVALDIIHSGAVDLLITDLNMPKMDGLALLTQLRQEKNELPVIVVTAYGTVETAVAAMKQGAFDFLMRPLDIDQVEIVINHALEAYRLKMENLFLRSQLDNSGWDDFTGQSQTMREVYDLIHQIAPTQINVFLSGETGTGKELAARAIHRHSGRKGLFVPVNCGAIPETMIESELFGFVRGAFTGADKERIGKFEFAQGGTIFLDEITEMPVNIQSKLLRVLQENTTERLGSNRSISLDVRVIAATNRNPQIAIAEGRLRADLYYRLNTVHIVLPPLRDRSSDILLLANVFTEKYCKQMGRPPLALSKTVSEWLTAYQWPGNVRELENIIERAVVLSRTGEITLDNLPGELRQPELPTLDQSSPSIKYDLEANVANLEIRLIVDVLEQVKGNKAKAARLLKISERSLWYKLKKYQLGAIHAEG